MHHLVALQSVTMAENTTPNVQSSVQEYSCNMELHDHRDVSAPLAHQENYDQWRKWAASGSPDLALTHMANQLRLDMCQHFDITCRWGRGGRTYVKFRGIEQLVQRMLDAANAGMFLRHVLRRSRLPQRTHADHTAGHVPGIAHLVSPFVVPRSCIAHVPYSANSWVCRHCERVHSS